MARAQDGVEKLAAAGLGEPAMTEVVKAILGSLEETTDAPSRPAEATRCGPPPAAPPVSVPAPAPPVSLPAPSGPPPAYSLPAAPADEEPEPVEGEQDEQEPHS